MKMESHSYQQREKQLSRKDAILSAPTPAPPFPSQHKKLNLTNAFSTGLWWEGAGVNADKN